MNVKLWGDELERSEVGVGTVGGDGGCGSHGAVEG